MLARKPPSYCRHKPTDRGYARFGTGAKPTYFPGRFNSPESVAAYRAALARWLATGSPDPPAPSAGALIGEIVDAFNRHADAHALYRKAGRPTGERHCLNAAFRILCAGHAHLPADQFGLAELDNLRAAMSSRRWAASTVRGHCSRVLSLLRWAEGRNLLPAGHVARLTAAERGLGTGRKRGARGRATSRKKPADLPAVGAVALLAGPPVCSMVWLQLLNGMRPGAVCAIRPRDLDRTGPLWRYRESPDLAAKTETETHWLGPRAQAILAPYLDACRSPDDFAFRPSRRPGAAAHGRMTRGHYRTTVARLCEKLGVPHWHPSQLRHNHGTLVRSLYGAEAAQLRLGHARLSTTEIYAERPDEVVRRIAREIG